MKRKTEQAPGVLCGIGKHADMKIGYAQVNVAFRQIEFANGVLDRYFGERYCAHLKFGAGAVQSGRGRSRNAFGRFRRPNKGYRIEEETQDGSPLLFAVAEERFHFIPGHRMPPVGIVDPNPTPQGAEFWFPVAGSLRPDDIHYRDPTAANGYWFAAFRDFD
jgi:hypothetical protein